MSTASELDLSAALQRYGLKTFRPGQAEVISQIVAGHDCLCVMPTGGGKSLCFQLPTLVRPGMTIVVSPLIALMKDQVDALQKRGISATLVNSSLTGSEQTQRLQQIAEGKYSLVYVAPERLRNQRFLESIRATPIQLLAIDEAHCISEWGHDFRPDYARIGQFREWLGGVQTVALTATATPRVRQDIVQILKLQQPKQFITGFARSNLQLGVINCRSDREKEEQILEFLAKKPGSGIIYAATRKRCEELSELLSKELKISLGAYHAGLTIEQRKFIQEQFMKDELQAIVATNAFGMGIDKADLRYVIHYNMPGSLEAYYQEAGRAGRDGLPSQCVLLFSFQDRYIQEFFIDNSYPPPSVVKEIYDYLRERPEDPIELTQQEIREILDLEVSNEGVGTSLQILARTGVLERLEAGQGLAMIRLSSDLPTLVDLLPRSSERRRKVLRVLERAVGDRRYEAVYVHPRWLMQQTDMDRDSLQNALRELSKLEAVEYIPPFRGRAVHFRSKDKTFEQLKIDFKQLEERKRADYEKLDQVMSFAESKRCRQLSILKYFGDPAAAPCGNCDRCLNRTGFFPVYVAPKSSEKAEVQAEVVASKTSVDVKHSDQVVQEPLLPGEVVALLRKVLGAVERMHGRLGKNLVAQYLAGSENAKVQRLRLHRLPEFAMLSQLRQTDVNQVLDSLITAGLLEKHEVNRHRPTLSISEVGKMVAGNSLGIPQGFRLPPALLKKLIALVRSTSTAPPKATSVAIPQEQVQSDRSVSQSLAGNAAVTGTVVARQDPPTAVPTPNRSVSIEEALEDWHWTWVLAEKGFALFECAAIRRKTTDGVLRDLASAARAKKLIPLQTLFDSRLCEIITATLERRELEKNRENGGELPSEVLQRFPGLPDLLRSLQTVQLTG